MEHTEITEMTREVRRLIEARLGIRSRSLDMALRRARRHLPRALRRRAEMLIEAEQLAQHPKLARRIDRAALSRTVRDISDHLASVDTVEERKTRRLRILAGAALNLLVFAALLMAFLRWRGLF